MHTAGPEPEWTVMYAVRLAWTGLAALVAGIYLVDRWPPRHLALGYALLVFAGFVAIKLVDLWRARRHPEPPTFVRER